MMRFIKVAVILLLFKSSAFAQEPAKVMPDFDFLDSKAAHFKKADLQQNQKTLIVFFDATCSHCQKAGTFFNSHLNELKPYNVLFITMDEQKTIQLFMDKYAQLIPSDNNIKILRDTAQYFVPNFLPKRYPAIFVYNKNKQLDFYTNEEKEFDTVLDRLKLKE